MFILNPPYISELLKETIKKNKYKVVKNSASVEEMTDYEFLLDDSSVIDIAKNNKDFKLYANSENSIEWIINNLDFTDIPQKINLCKDKVKFRKLLQRIYPDFYFREITVDEIKLLDKNNLKYPFILKPAVGFLSFGVYPVNNEADFERVILNIDKDIDNFKNVFPKEVVDSSKFIIEEMIDGEEYAVDAYYNSRGEAVILNIFHHPFFDENDVSDRIYYTSKKVIQENIKEFQKLLTLIGKEAGFKNFPMHIEVRRNGNKIVPIEINPMRFAGWCVTDLASFAYNINIYECFEDELQPDWNKILNSTDEAFYYFICADIPSNIDKSKIKSVDYDSFISKLSHPLEVRKIDYMKKPLFAVIFGKTFEYEEIKKVLSLDLSNFFII